MKDEYVKKKTLTALSRIIIPLCLTFALFTLSIFLIFVPSMEKYMIDQKKELIRELNDSSCSLTCSLLSEYNQRVLDGELTLEDAQARAAKRIQSLRHGPKGEDYFWIIDKQSRIIMHPYLTALEGTVQTELTDSKGKHVFAEFIKTAETQGSGYVEHMWYKKDETGKNIPKISYVKLFEPWGWVVGTGVYVDDVHSKIRAITQRLFRIFSGILAIVLILSFYITWQALNIEKKRSRAEDAHRLDVLRLKKLRELNQMAEASLEELMEFSLTEAIELTQSRIGYLVFLNDDETEITQQTYSMDDVMECHIPDKEKLHHMKQMGVWKEIVRDRKAVIQNDYGVVNSQHGKTYPEGHVKILRYLTVPVFDGDKIVAVAGVGNKTEDYDKSEVEQLNLLMDGMWKIIHRKRSEVALRESEERYRLLAENATDNIWTLQLSNMRFLYVSPSIESLLGYSPEQIRNLPFKTYLTEASLNKMAAIFSEELEKENEPGIDPKRSWVVQIEQIRKDGSTVWMEIKACFLRNEAGNADRILGVSRDITERRHMERQLRQSQKMEAIGTLAGGIAHDFNNILSSIFGFTELAKMKCIKGSEMEKHLDKIFIAGIRARDLVRHISIFGRKQDVQRMPIPIVPLVKECMSFIRASISSNIEIIQDLNGSDYTVIADPSQIHQIIMNLCTNAAHAMKGKNGRLEVCLKPVQIENWEAFHIKSLKQGRYLKLTVSDSGSGIPEPIIDRIFEPFFTTKERGDGTGMGLSIVHGIVKDMGGAVSVYSELGRGTTFQLFFPAHHGKAEGEIYPNPLLIKGTGRILLVDDEDNIVVSAQKILTAMGYEVIGVTDSLEALEMFKQEPAMFDLVMTDMTMPKMTGIELSKEIVKIRKNIPIVLCTGFSDGLTSNMALDMGICHIVMKPVIAAELATVIHAALNNKNI